MMHTLFANPLVGLDAYSLTGPSGHEICENDIFAMLHTVRRLGADGLQAHLPDDPARMDEAFALAADLDLYLEPYIQLPIHWRNDAQEIERRQKRFPLICRAAARHGVRALHCTMGARERFEDHDRWQAFTRTTSDCLSRLAPVLRDHDVRIGIENHWDYSTYEIRDIVDRAGADIVGFGLDTGNLLILGEAPDDGVARAATAIVTTHLKDAMLFSTATGAARPVMPIGAGQIRMTEAVHTLYNANPAVHFTIEDHPIIYPVDYFQPTWLHAVPEVTTHDIATMAHLARDGDRRLAGRDIADPHAAELVPWSIRGPERLRADVQVVREMLRMVIASDETISPRQ